jgi:hypothetical protein
MIILGSDQYIAASFENEAELERVVVENAEYIFGPDSILLPKSMIRSADGFGTVPDGFAVDLAAKRWFIVEAELGIHSVWSHIAPQVTKQIVAASQPSSRKLLIELVIERIREDSVLRDRIEELGIQAIDIRHVLTETFEKPPIIGMPIDSISNDLRQWAQTLKNEVRLWIVRKLVDLRNPKNVMFEIPDEYRPVLNTSFPAEDPRQIEFFDVTVHDLILAGELRVSERLQMTYKPKGGERRTFEAVVRENGDLETLEAIYSSPSYAAVGCIQSAGSDRKTANGWTIWKTSKSEFLAQLRERVLAARAEEQATA